MLTDHIIMVRPSAFRFNPETGRDNVYQSDERFYGEVDTLAEAEFQGLLEVLRTRGVHVDVLEDAGEDTPDSIFPNNTLVTFPGKAFITPMYSPNRRREFKKLKDQYDRILDFASLEVTDFSDYEKALEGTGAMVLDRENRRCYAALSNRCDTALLEAFCTRYDFRPIAFRATHHGKAVYHTNVIMTLAEDFVLLAEELVDEGQEELLRSLKETGKEIIPLTPEEVDHFAGNCLELQGRERILVMSEEAHEHLDPEKLARIASYDTLVHAPLPVISTLGGGSARCMILENFTHI